MLSQKYLTQAVPLIGAAAGGTLNYVFMDYYQQMARVHFTLRELERRHDPDAVRACFDSLVRQEPGATSRRRCTSCRRFCFWIFSKGSRFCNLIVFDVCE